MPQSRHVFRVLAGGMVTMGVVMGAVFPVFALVLGVPHNIALSHTFITATLAAGLVVGALNFLLASRIVRPRLRRLAGRMRQVCQAMQQATFTGDWSDCNPDNCRLEERDVGELGSVAQSYNALLGALHNAHLVEDQIRTFTKTLSSRLDLYELSEQALALAQEISRAQGGAIALERRGEWQILTAHGLIHPELIIQSPAFQVTRGQAEQRRITLPPGVAVDAVLAHFTPSDVLVTPIEHHGVVLGWMIMASAAHFAEDVPRLLPFLMQGLGLALNNALLHDDLQRIAALDQLTGVYNRRFGLTRLDEEIARAARTRIPLSMLMLDLDHFKRINDTFGHLGGDRVLRHTAETCREMLRENDVLLRYGGEEFMVILPGATWQDAKDVAERIRTAVGRSKVEMGDRTLSVTVSIGMATSNELPALIAEKLISLADARLYLAKATGRDKVVTEGPTTPALTDG